MTDRQKDDIQNAVLAGMSVEDAYVYAGISAGEMAALEEDEEWQALMAKRSKQLEYSLLQKLSEIIDVQALDGKEGAVTWALSHLYPRYGNKLVADGQPLTINMNVQNHKADIEEVY